MKVDGQQFGIGQACAGIFSGEAGNVQGRIDGLTQGAGSNSMAMRTKPGDGVEAFLKVTPAISEKDHATGTFSAVLVVTNRKSKSALERTYQLTNGRYSLAATEN